MDNRVYEQRGLRWRDVRTGILGVAGIAVLVWLALVIGENNGMFTSVESVTLFTTDVNGLVEGNQVTISGRKVGTVERLEIAERGEVAGVMVHLGIRSEYFDLLTVDSRAVVKSLGVLGDKFVDLIRGHGRPLTPGGEIAMTSEPGIEELTASGLRTLDNVNRLGEQLAIIAERINRGDGTVGRLLATDDLGRSVEGVVDDVDRALSAVNTTLVRLERGNGLVPRLLNDPSMAARTDAVLGGLQQVVTDLRTGHGTLGKLIASDSLYTAISSLTRRVDSVTARLNNPTGSLGKLSDDPALYDNLNLGLRSLDSLLRDLKSHPERYVRVSVF